MSSYFQLAGFINTDFLSDLERRKIITSTFMRLNSSRREAIVAGILEEAALKGPASINIKEVARRAEVPVGSLYQYFNRRQGLIDFAIEVITKQMIEAFKTFSPYLADMPLRDALRAYLQGGDELATEYGGYYQFFARAAYQDRTALSDRVVQPVAEAMLNMTRDILAGARSRGEISPEIDFEAAVRLINTLIIAVYDSQFLPQLNSYYQITDKTITREHILETMLDFIEKALKGKQEIIK